jgi:hypothetical protein
MHDKATTCPDQPSFNIDTAPEDTAPEVTTNVSTLVTAAATATAANTLSDVLTNVVRGKHSNYAAQTLMTFAAWSYSDLDTFSDMVENTVGPNVETMMIQVKNEPLVVQATAQMIRTRDKKSCHCRLSWNRNDESCELDDRRHCEESRLLQSK